MAENEERILKFIWKVENYSFCRNLRDEFLRSPDFELDVFEGSSWYLKLYPGGVSSYENYLSIHLCRLATSSGPLGITIDYEIALLRPDSTAEYVKETENRCFRKGYSFGFDNLAVREEILGSKKSTLLPKDILTVQCRIFPKGTQLKRHTEIFAKTHLELERYVFRWKGENCFSRGLTEYGTLPLLYDRRRSSFKLYTHPVDQVNYLTIHFDPSNWGTDVNVFRCKLGILDANDSVSRYILDKHIYLGNRVLPLIPVDEILKQKSLYLPNDRLTLHCDFTCSFRIQYSQIEVIAFDNAISCVLGNEEVPSEIIDILPKNHSCSCTDNYASFKRDFQNLYQEGTLCDFTLKVEKEDIQAHKVVLGARSPVFKAMLTSNMKENEKNFVVISDLDANTVRCLLTFMYTDTTGDLNWETAKKLYFAADKYSIMKLKRICSNVLKQNLCVSNVGEILSLANLHGDDDLKDLTVHFISSHDTEVICSTEWKTFMSKEVHLAAEVMRDVFLKKAGSSRGKI